MENRVVTTRNINIQLNNARKRSRKTFYELKEKNETSVPIEIEPPTIENCEKEGSIRQWKKSTTLIVGDSMLAGIEEVGVYPETGVKVRIFPCATAHDMYDYLKPLLKKNLCNPTNKS